MARLSRWFRHYAGMMRDDKLVSVAIKSKQPVERVVWVWGAILESAAEIDDDGLFRFDAAEAAYFLRADETDIRSVVDALADAGRLAEDRVVHWGDRQFKSDRSAERQAAYRDRKRSSVRDGNDKPASPAEHVTSPSRHGDAPETETELEEHADQRAPKRSRADLDRIEADLREAAGLQSNPSPMLMVVAPILGLLDRGFDIESDILPVVRAVASRAKRAPQSWDYFVKPIIEAAERRTEAANGRAPPGKPQGSRNVFERLKGQNDGHGGPSGGTGPLIDAVRSVPDLRGQDERDDSQGLSGGDRRMLTARAS